MEVGLLFGFPEGKKIGEARQYMKEMKKLGIEVFVNGERCAYQDVNSIHKVLENTNYMSDYESDEKGKIIQVTWNRVRLE